MLFILFASLLLMSHHSVQCMDHIDQPNPPMYRAGDLLKFTLDISTDEYEEELARNKTDNERNHEEQFDHYFCDPKETEHYDDILKTALLRKSLLVQLCVAASKEKKQAHCFQGFLAKLKAHDFVETKKGSIEHIAITNKDLCNRLLACIPTGHMHSCINGKKVQLVLREYETEQDKIENAKIKAYHQTLPAEKWEWGKGITPISTYLNYSGKELHADYYFETDMTHHQQVVAEYNKLIQ